MRKLFHSRRIVYTRYVDDLVFSSDKPLTKEDKKTIFGAIEEAGFKPNHRKTKNLSSAVGDVSITGVVLKKVDGRNIIIYPQIKRRRLHGMLMSYIPDKLGRFHFDWPEKCSGLIAGFIHYLRIRYGSLCVNNVWTMSDRKTFGLCIKFQEEAAKNGFSFKRSN